MTEKILERYKSGQKKKVVRDEGFMSKVIYYHENGKKKKVIDYWKDNGAMCCWSPEYYYKDGSRNRSRDVAEDLIIAFSIMSLFIILALRSLVD